MNKKFLGLDILKFICSILIVFLHINPFSKDIYFITKAIGNLGVPCFFIISGFFFYSKLYNSPVNKHREIFIHYIKRLAILLSFWLVVYFICSDFWWIIQGDVFANLFEYLNRILLGGQGFFLWYIVSLIVGVTINYLLFRAIKEYLLIVALVVFLIGAIPFAYHFIIDGTVVDTAYNWYVSNFVTVRNGIFFAFPCVSLGILVARYGEQLCDKKIVVYGLLVISLIIFILECLFIRIYLDALISPMQISVIILAFSLVLLCYNMTGETKLSFVVRKLSFLIYVIHPLIIQLISTLLTTRVFVRLNIDYYWWLLYPLQIPVVVIMSILIGLIIIRLSKRIKIISKIM